MKQCTVTGNGVVLRDFLVLNFSFSFSSYQFQMNRASSSYADDDAKWFEFLAVSSTRGTRIVTEFLDNDVRDSKPFNVENKFLLAKGVAVLQNVRGIAFQSIYMRRYGIKTA